MLNRVVLVGRLTKDIDLRYTPNGIAVANFTLAVNRPFSGQDGNREADFIQIQVWRKQAENAAQYLKKGSLAGVDGRIQTRNFEGDDGKRVYITEVVADSVQFLEPKNSGGNTGSNTGNNSSQNANTGSNTNSNTNANNDPFRDSGEPIDISDDDLPF